MITYEPFYKTLKRRNITEYKLTKQYNISRNTISRIKHGKSISTVTLNRLCVILDCDIEDIISFKK